MKKNKLILILLLAIYPFIGFSQINFDWSKKFRGMQSMANSVGASIALDNLGNVYVTGTFNLLVDFNPGIGDSIITSYNPTYASAGDDIFLVKLDGLGNFLWAKNMGSESQDRGISVAVDNSNNVYISGVFSSGLSHFGSFTFNHVYNRNAYICKIDPAGNFLWAKSIAEGNSFLAGDRTIAVGPSGNIFVTGHFSHTTSFGSISLTAVGYDDVFVAKMDPANGNFIWAKNMGGAALNTWGTSLAIDQSGNVYTIGRFEGTVDFDPGSGTHNIASTAYTDAFIVKLNNAGNFQWATKIGCTQNVDAISIASYNNHIFITGRFYEQATFGSITLNSFNPSPTDNCSYITKLDNSGNFIWAKRMGGDGVGNFGKSVAVDNSGTIYCSGQFAGTGTFGGYSFSAFYRDMYLCQLDQSGNFLGAQRIGPATSNGADVLGNSVAVDDCGGIYTTGRFSHEVDFDPTSSSTTMIAEGGSSNGFVLKLNKDNFDINASYNDPICENEDLELYADNGGDSYSWTGPNSFSSSQQNPTILNVSTLNSGMYIVTAVSSSGCIQAKDTVMVTIDPSPTANASSNSPICVGENIQLTASNVLGATYSWSGPGGFSSSVQNPTITNSAASDAGTYTLTVTNNGCSSDDDVSVIVTALPTASASYNNPICEGDDIQLSGTSLNLGATYSWTGPNGYASSSQNPTISSATSSDAGTYSLTVTDNGCSNDDDVTVVVNPNPSATASATNTTICEGDDIELTAGGVSGATYSWTGPNGFTSSNQNPTVPNTSSSDAGTYTLTVTNNGCSSNDDVTITINSPLSFTVDSTDPTCGNSDGDITITASGATSTTLYSIDNGANFSTSNTFTGLASGNYQIVVRDDNGCEATQTVSLSNAGAPTIDNIVATETSCTSDDGTITITASGGTGTLQYSIDNGTTFQSSGSFTGLGAGNYDVVVKDNNDCETNGTISINQMNAPSLTLDNSQDVVCNGADDGSAEVSATGGTSPYTFGWTPNVSTSENGTNLSAGDYTVTVTDGAGCSDTVQFTINEPATIAITETITNTDCGLDNGSISLQTTGGDGNYTYAWLPNVSTSASATGLSAGNYDVTVTDGNGCTQTGSYTVGAAGSFALNIIPENISIKQGESIDVHLEIEPGITVDSILWSPEEGLSCSDCTDPVASPKETTTYYVQVIDENGCSAMDSITITITSPCAKIYIPTSFSPNGDGMNDLQCVMGDCIATLDFTIFNRWGEVVFQTADFTKCWDGMFRGKLVQTGVYVYKLKATLDNGEEIEESGNINVIR